MNNLSKQEQKSLNDISESPYMCYSVSLIEDFVKSSKIEEKEAYKIAFDKIHDVLLAAKDFVSEYLKKRIENGEIKDEKQALKSIVGNSFSQAIEYIFLKNKQYSNIHPNIYITSKKSKVPNFDLISTIKVDNETQKPDCDLVIYSLKEDESLNKCLILSLKTSLRERAGQTYKWKLLMEIATSGDSIKKKFNITYDSPKMPLVCFATVDFYDEIKNPQHRGMFKFFDKSFIAKDIDNEHLSRLSAFPNYVNSVL